MGLVLAVLCLMYGLAVSVCIAGGYTKAELFGENVQEGEEVEL